MLRKSVFCVVIFLLPSLAGGVGEKIDLPIKGLTIVPKKVTVVSGVEVLPELNENFADYSFEYRWTLNGEDDLFETSSKYPGELLKRGDRLKVKVIPAGPDGNEEYSAVLPEIEVVNAPPEITSQPDLEFAGNTFTYQVEAHDPDGDNLHFSLDGKPEGMIIDEESGLLTWEYSSEETGAFQIKILAEDGHGGRAEQSIGLNLSSVEKGAGQ